MHKAEPGPPANRPDRSMRGAPVQGLAVASAQDRTFAAFADRQVNGPRRARNQQYHGGLVALADNPQDPMAALDSEVFNVGGTGFADPQAVQSQ